MAGCAESDGGSGNDTRPVARYYSDYAFESFNQNKPIDQFLREQLAGDELISGKPNTNDLRHVELLTATGFMRMAPDSTQSSNSLTDRNQAAADAVQVIGSSMLGLTVAARSAMITSMTQSASTTTTVFAIFDPVFPLQKWQQPSARLVDVTSAEDQKKAEEIEARAKEMDAAIQAKKTELAKTIQADKLSDVPEEVREETLQAVLASAKDRTERQKELLDLYPMVKPVSFIAGFLVEYDNAAYREFEKQKAGSPRCAKPNRPSAWCAYRTTGRRAGERDAFRAIRTARVKRWNRANSPSCRRPANPRLADKRSTRTTTGRRIAPPHSQRTAPTDRPGVRQPNLAAPRWARHVGTPGDFGLNGEPPTRSCSTGWPLIS